MTSTNGSELPLNDLNQPPEGEADNGGITSSRRRLELFKEMDRAGFSRVHVKIVFVAGIGFFTDAYDLFAINIASIMIGTLYGHASGPLIGGPGKPTPINLLKPGQDTALKISSSVGNLIGQLVFGWLADLLGRKRMYGIELCIMIVATFAQAIAGHGHAISLVAALIIWRLFMGIGIGGDYPVSAILTSEFSATRFRGRLMAAVFSMQGWGQLAAAVVTFIVIEGFKTQLENDSLTDPVHVDYLWRLIIGLGCIPCALALYSRLTIPETPRFTTYIEENVQQAVQDVETFLHPGILPVNSDAVVHRATRAKRRDFKFMTYLGEWENAKRLVGTAYSWFAIDVAFYGLGLNTSILLNQGFTCFPNHRATDGPSMYEYLRDISCGNVILSIAALIPGYYVTFFLIDRWGRKPIQLMGFSMLTIIFIILGAIITSHAGNLKSITITDSTGKAFIALYFLAAFFQNFGPNSTSFIIPGEVFPTRYRGTAHGISAAMGKLGAIAGQLIYANTLGSNDTIDPTSTDPDTSLSKAAFFIFAGFMVTGVCSTLLIKEETTGRTLEDISGEDQESVIAGPENQ